jgi:hypothetical protein
MSGGSFDYMYYRIQNTYEGRMEDIELNEMINDLCEVLHDLEWWQSGDYGEEDYRETVRKFKKKWFGKTQKARLEKAIEKATVTFKKQLRDTFGVSEVE